MFCFYSLPVWAGCFYSNSCYSIVGIRRNSILDRRFHVGAGRDLSLHETWHRHQTCDQHATCRVHSTLSVHGPASTGRINRKHHESLLENNCMAAASKQTPKAPIAFNHKKLISGRNFRKDICSLKNRNMINTSTINAAMNMAFPFTRFK
jgi:hypothetical protein